MTVHIAIKLIKKSRTFSRTLEKALVILILISAARYFYSISKVPLRTKREFWKLAFSVHPTTMRL